MAYISMKKTYKHNLTNHIAGACGYAESRARIRDDKPGVLVINALYQDPTFRVRREGLRHDIVTEQIPSEAIIAVYSVGNITEGDLLVFE